MYTSNFYAVGFVVLGIIFISTHNAMSCECTFSLASFRELNMGDVAGLVTEGDRALFLRSNGIVKELRKIGPSQTESVPCNNVTKFSSIEPLRVQRNKNRRTNEKLSWFDSPLIVKCFDIIKTSAEKEEVCEKCAKAISPLIKNYQMDSGSLVETLSRNNTENESIFVYPIAHSVKTYGENNQAIPLLEHESTLMIRVNLQHDQFWMLVCCSSSAQLGESGNIHVSIVYDTASDYEIDRLKNKGAEVHSSPEGTIISRKCLQIFSAKPTVDEIRNFIANTDFGNNNIVPYTDFASFYNCKVQYVSVNVAFSELFDELNNGLAGEKLRARKTVYNRALVGTTSTTIVGSRPVKSFTF